jgi:hypothetical protein
MTEISYDMEQDFLNFINIYTDKENSQIQLIDENHPFNHFINGLTHNKLKDQPILGYYNEKTLESYFYTQRPDKFGAFYTHGWKMFVQNDDADVKIYSKGCGTFYESNEYETDEKYFYKYIFEIISEKIFH